MIQTLSPAQVRAARALLGWSQQDLAKQARVAASTIADFERGQRTPIANNSDAIRSALESAGVAFFGGGALFEMPPAAPALIPTGQPIRWIEASDLGDWADRRDGQAAMPELLSRLISATCSNAAQLRFPAGDSVQYSGWDGTCVATVAVEPVPHGASAWEVGSQRNGIKAKADEDYDKRTTDPGAVSLKDATYVFVTPRRWPGKDQWAAKRKAEGSWADVKALDADDLVHWIDSYPAVAYWLATRLRKRPAGIGALEDVWTEWSLATAPPLTADLVLAGRDEEAAHALRWLRAAPSVLSVQAESTEEALAFFHSAIMELPPQYATIYLSRALVAANEDVARILGDAASPLIIALRAADAGLAQLLAARGHHVFLALGPDSGQTANVLVLSRPRRDFISEALCGMGFERGEADRLSGDSARSLAVIRRLIPSAPGRLPRWAQSVPNRALVAAILAGGWDESVPADCALLGSLSGLTYNDVARDLAPLTNVLDGPLRKSGNAWRVASRRDAWLLLAPFLTDGDVDGFLYLFAKVFNERDPQFALSSNERFFASTQNNRLPHSRLLRQSMAETLILMATLANNAKNVTRCEPKVGFAIEKLLRNSDAALWWTLDAESPRLAEAAPREFLRALDDALGESPSPIVELFDEDDNPLFSSHHVNGLLWALEKLAWSPTLLGTVAYVLSDLAVLDPGGRQGNRPERSLRAIFLLWSPQTFASLDERLRILDRLRTSRPDVAWKLMLSISPRSYDTSFPTSLPQWRDFGVDGGQPITHELVARGADEIATRLLEDVRYSVQRWIQLIETMASFPGRRRADLRRLLLASLPHIDKPEDRALLRDTIRKFLNHHRSFPDAEWSLPEQELNDFQEAYEYLEPTDPIDRVVWAFAPGCGLPQPPAGGDWQAAEKAIKDYRVGAIRQLVDRDGVDAVMTLARRSESPGWVAEAVVIAALPDQLQLDLVKKGLRSENDRERRLARAMIAGRSGQIGDAWSDYLLETATVEGWEPNAVLRTLHALPGVRRTWEAASAVGPEMARSYWQGVTTWTISGSPEDFAFAAEQLINERRARDAVHFFAQHLKVGFPPALIIRALFAAVEESKDADAADSNEATMFGYHVTQLLNWLDSIDSTDRSTIARIEWAYFALLQYSERRPKELQKALATDPSFFMLLLKTIYAPSPDSGIKEPEYKDTEQAANIASHAWNVLHDWDHVPGANEAGEIDAVALQSWIKTVRILCSESGRREVGDERIGNILAASKPDADGMWPPKAVREVIEATRSKELENGIVLGVVNRLGVTTRGIYDGGEQERALEAKYRRAYEALSEWPRTAAVLDELARNFAADAEREDQRVERRQWQ
ncbi:helix-turn-helix transcriptional regulator [Caballeronia sp. ATUFL_M2_KS44]|uniref:helix-turn-helix domain-containing protein n=1 Tax=Caballeronia sp. ATUFL_M2_KS44 TaxID=2921767 RepID=UPI0020285508|nr:helix-turn-helix transcriptional regulator [Caballeronia sp. ATUFL_M2_KS44]